LGTENRARQRRSAEFESEPGLLEEMAEEATREDEAGLTEPLDPDKLLCSSARCRLPVISCPGHRGQPTTDN
jgi:hypothetical protein